MKLEALRRFPRNARRVGEILKVMGRYGLADWLRGVRHSWIEEHLQSIDGQAIRELKPEERVRLALMELGPTFIKLGQMLSTRPDIIGGELAFELAKLQASGPGEPFEVVLATIEAELGRPAREIFDDLEPVPMGSASIAQVFAARLPDGREVVVKVQRAGIAEKMLPDLEILVGLAELAEKHGGTVRLLQPAAVVRQFRRMLLRELDFTHERQALEEFGRNFAKDPTVRFPVPLREYSGRRVLTMERLHGVLGTDSVALANSGADLNAFARRGAKMYLEMIFRDSFYHADPHPGNLLLLPNGVVGVIDCGLIGRLDGELRERVESLLIAISESDAAQMTEAVVRLGAVPTDCPRDELRAELDDLLADHIGRPLQDLHVGSALTDLMEILRRFHILLPPALAMLLRTLILLEGTSRRLDRRFSLAEVVQPYYYTIVRRRMSPHKVFSHVRRSARDWQRLLDALPRDLGDVLARFRSGTLDLHVDHRRLDPIVNRLVMGMLTAALIVGSSLLWSMNAPPLLGGVSVAGALGYLIAMWWCWRLYRAIRRSGSMDSSQHH